MQFWIAFLALFLFPLWFPKLQLLFFAPYLICMLYKHPFFSNLWRCVLAGLIVDLFSSAPLFGLTSLNYLVVLLILRTQKHNFFQDKLATIPLMTAFFSILSTFFSALFLLIFTQNSLFSARWIVTDLFEMALLDALYAFILFSLPFQLTKKIARLVR